MSVVTAPAVPPPAAFTAAACALVALVPVTGFSCDSCACVPCCGKLPGLGCPVVLELGVWSLVVAVDVVEEPLPDTVEVAALALKLPATTAPPIAPAATRPAIPAHRAARRGVLLSIC